MTCSAIGLNFFSLVFSFAKVPVVWRSEYLVRSVCSSSSDHFFRFMMFRRRLIGKLGSDWRRRKRRCQCVRMDVTFVCENVKGKRQVISELLVLDSLKTQFEPSVNEFGRTQVYLEDRLINKFEP